jgi:hypothetical protein
MLEEIDIRKYLGLVTATKKSYGYELSYLQDANEPYPYMESPIHWCIVGCESGPKRRPCKYEWIDSIVAQCEAASVPCFVKQINNQQGNLVKMPEEYPQEYPECQT